MILYKKKLGKHVYKKKDEITSFTENVNRTGGHRIKQDKPASGREVSPVLSHAKTRFNMYTETRHGGTHLAS